MTQPTPPDPITPAAVAAALAAAQTTVAGQNTMAATVLSLSSAVAATRDAAAAYAKTLILALWAAVDPYDGRAVQDYTVAAARHMVTAQGTVARQAGAAQAAILSTMGVAVPGVVSNPVNLRAPGVDAIDGRLMLQRPDSVTARYATRGDTLIRAEDMTTQAVFNRPARTQRALEAQGRPRTEAAEVARGRTAVLIDDGLMLAQRYAEAEVLQQAVNLDDPAVEIIGYRRVIHPELSRTGVCGLCIAASDQVYKVGTLLPIHDRCKCTTAPITAEHDPGDDVNAVDLGALYDAAGSTSGADLKRVRYQLNEHGELGPVLVPKKRSKTRAAKSANGTSPRTEAEVARTQLRALEANLARMRSEGEPEDSSKIEYHERQIAKLRRQAGDTDTPEPSAGGGGGDDGGTRPPSGGDGTMDDWDDDRITPKMRVHILDGDNRGGGHRHNSTRTNKTLFPATWSDAKCLAAVSAALDNPYTTSDDVPKLRNDIYLTRFVVFDGVRVAAQTLKAKGSLHTAYPLDGPGVFKTGKTDGTSRTALSLGKVAGVPLPS